MHLRRIRLASWVLHQQVPVVDAVGRLLVRALVGLVHQVCACVLVGARDTAGPGCNSVRLGLQHTTNINSCASIARKHPTAHLYLRQAT
jgi:hypothetical protein